MDRGQLEAVALVPEAWPSRPESVELSLKPEVTLPLFAVMLAGERSAAVVRLMAMLMGPLSPA